MNSTGNYPPGAASDPQAPYNEPLDADLDVFVVETVTRKATVSMRQSPYGEYDRYEIAQAYGLEYRNVQQTMECCRHVLRALIKSKVRWVADCYLPRLLADCEDWTTEETDVDFF